MKRHRAIQLFVICMSLQTISFAQASPKLWGTDASDTSDESSPTELDIWFAATPPPGFTCPQGSLDQGPLDIGHESLALDDFLDSAVALCVRIRAP